MRARVRKTLQFISHVLCAIHFSSRHQSFSVPLTSQAHAMHCIHGFLDIRPGPNTTVPLEIILGILKSPVTLHQGRPSFQSAPLKEGVNGVN